MDGLIDIHCHLLPGVDDGCEDLSQTIEAIARLRRAGFVGSICTPHVWPEMFEQNQAHAIRGWTQRVRDNLRDAGVDYPLWPGGEVRLHKNIAEDMKKFGVPTLGDSRYVLTDVWFDKWPRWMVPALQWFLQQGYTPILAHPERINCPDELPARLDELRDMGVLLQGNFRCLTGEEGYHADRLVRQFLAEGRYSFMALDAHKPETLEGRLDGVSLLVTEFGQDTLARLAHEAPRRIVTP